MPLNAVLTLSKLRYYVNSKTSLDLYYALVYPFLIITAQYFPLEGLMLCPKQEQAMEYLILDLEC